MPTRYCGAGCTLVVSVTRVATIPAESARSAESTTAATEGSCGNVCLMIVPLLSSECSCAALSVMLPETGGLSVGEPSPHATTNTAASMPNATPRNCMEIVCMDHLAQTGKGSVRDVARTMPTSTS